MYINYISKGVKIKKICVKVAFVGEQMTKFELEEIENFDLVKS